MIDYETTKEGEKVFQVIDPETMKEINMHKFLSKNVIKTSDEAKKICIDVGLAGAAPHSALWLYTDSSRCSLGIEPLQIHWDALNGVFDEDHDLVDENTTEDEEWDPVSGKPPPMKLPAIRLNKNAVIYKNKKVCNIENRFFDIKCAIDNIEDIRMSNFYRLINSGASSLLEPNISSLAADNPQRKVEEIEKIKCLSLEKILDYVDWRKFEVIEHLKVDCEGKDLEVIKSIGHYMDKVVFLTHEASPHSDGFWHNENTIEQLIEHMKNLGFLPVGDTGGDLIWVNQKYMAEVIGQVFTCEVIWPQVGAVPHPPPYVRFVPVVVGGKCKFVSLCLTSEFPQLEDFSPRPIQSPGETLVVG